jgi:microcystin degradation protein MlrC
MKIGIGGLSIESCTFSPLLSREEDFTILRGTNLLESYPFLQSYQDVSNVPLLYARALPGGPVEAHFYERVKKEFLHQLEENGPLDGLFLHMHGAVNVEGMLDAEGDFLASIRSLVGKDCFIAASYDLHGNVSPPVMANLDLLSAYRTAPHIDWYETLERAYSLQIKCLKEGVVPYKAFIPVPVLFSGEKTSTEWEPAASLYRKIPEVISGDEVMDASILIGYVWADEPRSSACVTAFGLNREKVEMAARYLAQQFWDVRSLFQFGVTADSVDNCIQIASHSTVQPVVISDSGDNPTAGGAGDTPYVLERMLALRVKDAVFASIADAEAVRKCEAAGAGSTLELSLGGKLDPVHAMPLTVRVQVRSLHVLPWTLSSQGDKSVLNHIVVVDAHSILVIVTEHRTPFHRIQDFNDLGIDPYQHKIVVVKIGYLEPELKSLAAKALLALSPGAVNQDTVNIKYNQIHRPMYPFDPVFEWSP